ncbi:14926_t:CDS:2 [Funneliformis caledonium]|uniref:14926_t:CDS:1 n=1 Tax=Funneliformis caledonium TaxID=1117310 RepID=A0A9N9CQK0_9GLOM|nr:14926_t:CDS:2 [Funneliformis caledonium]
MVSCGNTCNIPVEDPEEFEFDCKDFGASVNLGGGGGLIYVADPLKPAHPTHPANPIHPTNLTNSTNPTHSTNPTQPTDFPQPYNPCK